MRQYPDLELKVVCMELTGMVNVRQPKSDVFAIVDAASKQDLGSMLKICSFVGSYVM
jgi:hypothetical protein